MRILEVVLPASDPEALARFHAAFTGSTTVRFQAGPAVCSHWALNVAPGRFAEAVAFAAERVELLHDDVPFPDWRARSANFYDPGGNIVELIARERAPGSDLFLEVSEVGLPVTDVSRPCGSSSPISACRTSAATVVSSARSATTAACSSSCPWAGPGCSPTAPRRTIRWP